MVGNTYANSIVRTPNPTHFRESMVRCILAPVSPLLFEMEMWEMEMGFREANSRARTGASVSLVSGKIKMGGFQISRFAKEKGKMVGAGHFSKQGIFSRIYLANYSFFRVALLLVRLPDFAQHNLPPHFSNKWNQPTRRGGKAKKVLKEKKRCLHGKERVFLFAKWGGREAAAVSPRWARRKRRRKKTSVEKKRHLKISLLLFLSFLVFKQLKNDAAVGSPINWKYTTSSIQTRKIFTDTTSIFLLQKLWPCLECIKNRKSKTISFKDTQTHRAPYNLRRRRRRIALPLPFWCKSCGERERKNWMTVPISPSSILLFSAAQKDCTAVSPSFLGRIIILILLLSSSRKPAASARTLKRQKRFPRNVVSPQFSLSSQNCTRRCRRNTGWSWPSDPGAACTFPITNITHF